MVEPRDNRLGTCYTKTMKHIDWTECALIEIVPGKMSGQPVLRGTRLPHPSGPRCNRGRQLPGGYIRTPSAAPPTAAEAAGRWLGTAAFDPCQTLRAVLGASGLRRPWRTRFPQRKRPIQFKGRLLLRIS
jgi:hypothetical protein